MSEILFLSHRIPYPPNKGDKIRSYHLLRHLARQHRVHVGTFIDDPDDWRYADELRKLCGECCIVPLNRTRATVRSLRGLLTGEALTLPYYANAELRSWVTRLAQVRPIEAAIVYSSAMAQYVEELSVRRIADFVDVDSDKWLQYAAKAPMLKRWIYRREGVHLAAYEAHIAETFEATFLVSPAEAELMKRIAPKAAVRIQHFENGVDSEYFAPGASYADPHPPGTIPIVFTGAMDYWPNIDAVTWFADEILPTVHRAIPNAVFCIVGTRPSEAVRALTSRPGITVTGSVPDVRPFLAHARVAVAPLRIARGVQNKVLEAMAMAKPVVVTPEALEGIDAEPGVHLMLAQSAAGFAAAVISCIEGRADKIATRSRQRVLQGYSWEANLIPVLAAVTVANGKKNEPLTIRSHGAFA